MKKEFCCIFGAGDYFGYEKVPENSFVIAADAGIKKCEEKNIVPDLIIGDFDSLGYDLKGSTVIKLPKIKDDTDTLAAVKAGLERGYKNFLLFGCTGGRLSHTVANIQTLTYIAKHDGIGFLADKEELATVVCKGIDFDKEFSGFLSVFAAEGNVIISESGLKYEIEKEKLTADFPLGVSNEFVGKKAKIDVQKGSALIIFSVQKYSKLP